MHPVFPSFEPKQLFIHLLHVFSFRVTILMSCKQERESKKGGIPFELEKILLADIEHKCGLSDIGRGNLFSLKSILDSKQHLYPPKGQRWAIIARIARLKDFDKAKYLEHLARIGVTPHSVQFKMARSTRTSRKAVSQTSQPYNDDDDDDEEEDEEELGKCLVLV